MEKQPCVYIMASRTKGVLYIGVSSNLPKRIWEHKNKVLKGFSSKYNVDLLVWYEIHETMESAILREKTLKKWNRNWKIRLIESQNPQWKDLYETVF